MYSFGVVLVELITGRKAMDIKRPKGQQCLTEWVKVQMNIKASVCKGSDALQGRDIDVCFVLFSGKTAVAEASH